MPGIVLIGVRTTRRKAIGESGFDTEDRLQDLVVTPPGLLAVEARHLTGEKRRALAPLVGTSTQRGVDQRAGPIGGEACTEERFFAASVEPSGEGDVAQRLLEWSRGRASRVRWGRGGPGGSFVPVFERAEGRHLLLAVWTSGIVSIQVPYRQRSFDPPSERSTLHDRLQRITGVVVRGDRLRNRPRTRPLPSPGAMAAFEPMLARMRRAEPGPR